MDNKGENKTTDKNQSVSAQHSWIIHPLKLSQCNESIKIIREKKWHKFNSVRVISAESELVTGN